MLLSSQGIKKAERIMMKNQKNCLYLTVFFVLVVPFFVQSQEGEQSVKRAIVIGATSGMGRQVAKLLATEGGYQVGLVGRRMNMLESLQQEIQTKTYIKQIDVTQFAVARKQLLELVDQMGGLDLILIAVTSFKDPFVEQDAVTQYDLDVKTIDVELRGFWEMADVAVRLFEKQRSGHLVGVSSISGVRGDAHCPVYSGAKAFVSTYLEGIRNYMLQNDIPVYVTDIMPGWVDIEKETFSVKPGTYWVTPLDKAARQIFEAIQRKKKIAYISSRQMLVKAALNLVPDCIYNAIGGF
jgi:short-subunit dehydrogenase